MVEQSCFRGQCLTSDPEEQRHIKKGKEPRTVRDTNTKEGKEYRQNNEFQVVMNKAALIVQRWWASEGYHL